MPRVKKTDRPVRLSGIYMPSSVYTRLHEILYSELEGKIPYGKLSEFLTLRTVEWLQTQGPRP